MIQWFKNVVILKYCFKWPLEVSIFWLGVLPYFPFIQKSDLGNPLQ